MNKKTFLNRSTTDIFNRDFFNKNITTLRHFDGAIFYPTIVIDDDILTWNAKTWFRLLLRLSIVYGVVLLRWMYSRPTAWWFYTLSIKCAIQFYILLTYSTLALYANTTQRPALDLHSCFFLYTPPAVIRKCNVYRVWILVVGRTVHLMTLEWICWNFKNIYNFFLILTSSQ